MKFVVAGASGNTGSVVAEALLADRHQVKVLVRDPRKAEGWEQKGAEVVVGGLDDVAGLTLALHGADGAYLLLPPNPTSPDILADNARRLDVIVRAVEASGLPHLVFLSSIGAQHRTGTGPVRALYEAERRLSELPLHVTFVRAAYFMENWAGSLAGIGGGGFATFIEPEQRLPMVATLDIGRTAARALVEGDGKRGEARQTILELAGPRDYAPAEIAAATAKLIGKPLRVDAAPESVMVGVLTQLGFTPDLAELFREMTHAINHSHMTWQTAPAPLGVTRRSLRGDVGPETVLARLLRT